MSISINSKTFTLCGKDFSYVMSVDSHGYLTNRYFGAKIPDEDLSYFKPVWQQGRTAQIDGTQDKYDDLMLEYSLSGNGDYRESAFLAEDPKGSRFFDLRYKGFELLSEKPALRSAMPVARGGETLVITLADEAEGFEAKLYYTVYKNENIITRRAELCNVGTGRVKLLRALSMTLDLYDSNYKMIKLWGNHENERNVDIHPLHHGVQAIGTARGTSSHEYNPFITLMRPNADEESGETIGVMLMYSGSHYEAVEVDNSNRARIVAGINPHDFCWLLEAGESFETPEAVICYSAQGLGGMSRSYHDLFRSYIINPAFVSRPRPVVLNSWEGMRFTFNKDRLFSAIDDIKGTGIDTFVLDDGWFGTRESSESALGDWFENKEKLGGGLKVIADHCRECGLNFGLWIEPEMVSPDSYLYRAHPDWAISTPDHKPLVSRNQCVLDLSRREVLDYIKSLMHDVIANSGASYIKWDMNRPLTENFSRTLPAERAHELQHRFMLGVYELAKYLTESFPDILFEGCASGGSRFDGGMLAYFPQFWTSDDTDAHERTKIQYGTSLCYPLSAISNHVSISPNLKTGRITPQSTRRDIAMNGPFGYEFDTKKIPAADLASIKGDVEKYREMQDLVLFGDLYRIKNTFEGNEFCQIIVSKDKTRAHLTYYQTINTHKGAPRIKVTGLDPNKKYLIPELSLTLSGAILEKVGLVLPRAKCDFATLALTFKAL